MQVKSKQKEIFS